MGLLSDPEYGSVKWVRVLKKINGPLCFLCYAGALVWFMMLANRQFNNETYFSENALLPGLVTNRFDGELTAKQYLQELLLELEDKYEDSERIPVPWLVGKMSQLHLEVYTHNFTLNYPLGQGQVFKGTNVYGILRGPRTASLEALVVSAPFRSLNSYQKGTTAGIALMLAFAKFARPQNYWAKDIIFLITEHEQLGMQAWLEAYHGLHSDAETFYTTLGSFWKPGTLNLDFGKFMSSFGGGKDHQKCLNPGTLRGRSGSIQAAINLEIHDPKIKYIEVKVEGLNGQLSNLDLVNLVHKLCVKAGVHSSYRNSYSWTRTRNKMSEWSNGLWTMLGMVSTQIAGIPNGNHGLFHRFGIEAVTLEGRDVNDPAGVPPRVNSLSSANFYRLGNALESILRSLNNLLERFHQSYFFYLLAATNRFISIGQYMPCLCLLCLAMLVRALSIWVSLQQESEEDMTKVTKTKRKESIYESEVPGKHETDKASGLGEKLDEKSNLRKRRTSKSETQLPGKQDLEDEVPKGKSSKKKKAKKTKEPSMSVVNLGANYLLVHLFGYAVMNSPLLLSQIGTIYFNQPSEVSVYQGLIAISVVLTLITPYIPRLRAGPITREELSLVNILLLIEMATVFLAVGMHNFPLGLTMATLYTPLALAVGVVTKDSRRPTTLLLKKMLCILLHPLCALSVAMIAYSGVLFPEETQWDMVRRGGEAAMQAIMFSIVDSLVYGNWLFNVVTTLLLPTWILFWQILCNKVEDTVQK